MKHTAYMNQLRRDIFLVGILFVGWRFILGLIEFAAPFVWPLREGFLGPLRWANFDGIHYLSIGRSGYFQYEQAFFPLYPLLIRYFSFLPVEPVYIAVGISHFAFFIGLLIFYRLAQTLQPKSGMWSVLFLLAFPTSFFFAAAYTESIFFLLIVSAFYLAEKRQWLWVGVIGAYASGARLFGAFLVPSLMLYKKYSRWIFVIPIGLLLYMGYLYQTVGDPLFFFHAQPAFGAGRSGSALILLPQVLWRYAKIIRTASPNTIPYFISVVELTALIFSLVVVWMGWKKKIVSVPYILFSVLVVIVPTLTGTLSSLPRYLLSAFPLFIIGGSMHNTQQKVLLFALSTVGLFVLCTLFLQGHFVS